MSFYSVTLKDRRGIDGSRADLNVAAAARRASTCRRCAGTPQVPELYRRGMQVLGLYRTFVMLIVVAIAGMSVFSTMLKSVNERVREIGTLRSLGYRRRHIGALFTVEAAMLAGLASCVGLVLSASPWRRSTAARFSYKAGLAAQAIPLTVSLLPRVCLFAAVFLSAWRCSPRRCRRGERRGWASRMRWGTRGRATSRPQVRTRSVPGRFRPVSA